MRSYAFYMHNLISTFMCLYPYACLGFARQKSMCLCGSMTPSTIRSYALYPYALLMLTYAFVPYAHISMFM